jgi:peroxiredoxin
MVPDELHKRMAEGDEAPPFVLTGPTGIAYSSTTILQAGPALLTFYRGGWCMCCQADLRDLVRTTPELRKAGLTVLGVFHELTPDANTRISEEYGLEFPIVNDSEGRVAEAFGVRRTTSEIQRLESEFGPELSAFKTGQPDIIPMQARFLINTNGIITRSEIIFDYNQRSNVSGLLPLLDRFQ